MTKEQIVEMAAELAHEANRMYCDSIGDSSQHPWAGTPTLIKNSARQGVLNILDGKVTAPGQSHEEWVKYKTAEGWTHGPVKDIEARTHPCLVPFDQLPLDQQVKDHLFFNLVKAILDTVPRPAM